MSTPYQKLSVPSISIEDINVDAIGSPAIATTCYMCGEGFREGDFLNLEWPHFDEPVHGACYAEHCEAYDRWNREEMRGA